VKAFLEEMAIQRVCGYGTCAETGENGGGKGNIACEVGFSYAVLSSERRDGG